MPKMTNKEAEFVVEMLEVMKFFPASVAARTMIALEVQSMCPSIENGKWLATRMIRLYPEWPGLPDLRAVYCSKFKPADGIEGLTGTTAFPEGIPSESPELPEPDWKQLPQSPDMLALIGEVADSVRIEPAQTRRTPEKVSTPSDAEIAAILEQQKSNRANVEAVKEALA